MSDSELSSSSSRLPGHQPEPEQPQLYRSCDACRASKLRCRTEPPNSPSESCLRCSERRMHCSFSPVAARVKRSSTRLSTNRRLCEIEKRVQDLRHQLHKKARPAGSTHARQSDEPNTGPPASLPARSSAHPQLGKSTQQLTAHWNYMSETQIEQMFRLYFQDQPLLLPRSALTGPQDHKQLQRKKPLLFLSILAASASITSEELASHLGIELDNMLKDSIYNNQEQSLEILQALWNHLSHHFDPSYGRHVEVLGYVKTGYEMAVGLANGAGLLGINPANGSVLMQHHELLDICRQVLIWEFARWLISVRTRRQLTPAHENMIRHSRLILEHSSNPSDVQIVALSKLSHITREAARSLFLGYTTAQGLTNAARDTICAVFEQDLGVWLHSCPTNLQNDALMLQYYTDMMIMCELLLPSGHHSAESLLSQSNALPSLEKSTGQNLKYRLHTLYQTEFTKRCILAAHGLLDIFIKTDPNQLKTMNFVIFNRAFYSLRFLLQIAHTIHVSPGNYPITLESLCIRFYLDAMCCQLRAASDLSKRKTPALWLNALQTRILPWYRQLESQRSETAKVTSSTAVPEVQSTMDPVWPPEPAPKPTASMNSVLPRFEDTMVEEASDAFNIEHDSNTAISATALMASSFGNPEEQWSDAAPNINMNDIDYFRSFVA